MEVFIRKIMIFTFKNQKISYNDQFKGKPILFLHGWGGNKDSFAVLKDFLGNKYRILSLTFPADLNEVWNLKDYSNLVEAFLKKLKLKKVFCVAHSFGGRIALNLANKYFEKMVLTGSAGIKPKFSLIKFFKILKYKILKKLVKLKLYPKESLNKHGSEDYMKLNASMKKTFINIISINQKNMLRYIKVKTLLYWGDKDKETPLYMAKIFYKKISNSKLIIQKGDHFIYLKKHNEFSVLIDNFFS